MRSSPLRTVAMLLVGGTVLATVAGCTSSTLTPTPTPTPSAPPASASDELASCIAGTWTLDVEHLSDTVAGLVDVPGIPLDEFAMDGDGAAEFAPDGEVDGTLDVRATGSLDDGREFDVPFGADFAGSWSVGEEPGTIAFADWTYEMAEGSGGSELELPRPMDFSDISEVQAECSADELRLTAGSVPLEVRWVRAED